MSQGLFLHVLLSATVYTVLAGIAVSLIGVGLKSAAAPRRSLAAGTALGLLSALLFAQPFLFSVLGIDLDKLDPAHYVGYFSTDPLTWLRQLYGTSGVLLGPAVSLFVGLGFLVVLLGTAAGISSMPEPVALKAGVFGGTALVALGLLWGLAAENLGLLDLSVPILALVSYPALAYFFARNAGPGRPETARRHSGLGIASLAVALLVPVLSVLLVPLTWVMLFPVFLLIGAPAGIVLAATGLFQRNRKKLFPVLGLALNATLLAVELVAIALAGAYS